MRRLSPKVWHLAWPMILSNITIPLLGMVDTAMVGHAASLDDMATVALGSVLFDFLFWGFGFLRMSTTGLTAQRPDKTIIFYQAATLALIIALCLILAAPLLTQLGTLFVNQDNQVNASLMTYIQWRLLSAPATLLNYVIIGYCFGRQNTKLPLLMLLITNLSAMGLDYLFVWVLGLNSQGIALSNVIAQSIGALFGLSRIYPLYLRDHIPQDFFAQMLSKSELGRLFHLNKDIFIRTLFLIASQAFFMRQSTMLGIEVIAANAILMHLQMLSSYGLDGFAIAAESLIGQAIGQKDIRAFMRVLRDCALWSGITALLISLGYVLFGPFLINAMTDLAKVQIIARHFLPWAIALPVLSMPGFLLDGVFIGATWSKPLRNAILFASLLVFLPAWWLSQPLGNNGLWLSYCAFMLARAGYLALRLSITLTLLKN